MWLQELKQQYDCFQEEAGLVVTSCFVFCPFVLPDLPFLFFIFLFERQSYIW